MKKVLTICLFGVFCLLAGCSAKKETAVFTQSYMKGMDTSITVEHQGDKITALSAKIVLDNATLQITNEASANATAKTFQEASSLKNSNIDYTEKETVITYDVPNDLVTVGASYKDAENDLVSNGFKKE